MYSFTPRVPLLTDRDDKKENGVTIFNLEIILKALNFIKLIMIIKIIYRIWKTQQLCFMALKLNTKAMPI